MQKYKDKRSKRNEIYQEIQSSFDWGISPYKAFMNPILDYPYLLFTRKRKYN